MTRNILILTLLTCALAAGSVPAGTPAGGDYVITRDTIDGGGGMSSGGDFVLTGTIGQPDAQPLAAAGGAFQLVGGFWAGLGALVDLIFRDGFEEP